MCPTIQIWALFGYSDFGVSLPVSSGFRNPMSPATIAPMSDLYSSENWVACHDARNAMSPNEIGFGKFVMVYRAFIVVLSMGLQHRSRSGKG